MPDSAILDEALVRSFRERRPLYEALAETLEAELHALLKQEGIGYEAIDSRVKTEDSFLEKVERKQYTDPLAQVTDICGLRIICYYPSDLDRVCDALARELVVHERLDKSLQLDPDRFGYASVHFIVSPPDTWSSPVCRPLRPLRAEVQVRTILMHAWAAVEHKLAYKKKDHVPSALRRKLFQLSALFEIADRQFDDIRHEREVYISQQRALPQPTHQPHQGFPDVDTLQQFLDAVVPNRQRRPAETALLFDELAHSQISSTALEDAFRMLSHLAEPASDETDRRLALDSLLDAIQGDLDQFQDRVNSRLSRWGQAGIVRAILDITHDTYWNARRPQLPERRRISTERWRSRLHVAREREGQPNEES